MKLETIIVIALVVVAALFFTGQFGNASDGSDPSDAGKETPLAVTSHFADKEYNEVPLNEQADGTFSVVTVQGKEPTGGIYFMRFDVGVSNQGTIEREVSIIEAYIEDAKGARVREQTVTNAFRCIMNRKVTLGEGAGHVFNTDPNSGGNCGSGVWIPTTLFESYSQPLTLRMKLKVESALFGQIRETTKELSTTIYIAEDDGSFGAVSGEIVGGTSEFLEECQIPPEVEAPETILCPGADIVGSVCEGLTQTCQGGLWPGCPDYRYGEFYTIGKEVYGNRYYDFKTTCTDGKDNDCDGLYDKPELDNTCPRGNCDYDCPSCVISIRTNADVIGNDGFINAYKAGTWVAVDINDDFLTSAGFNGIRTAGVLECTNKEYNGENIVAYTKIQKYPVTHKPYGTSADYFHIWYTEDDGDCRYVEYYTGSSDRCKVGDEQYPDCISKFPVLIPHTLAEQEVCTDY